MKSILCSILLTSVAYAQTGPQGDSSQQNIERDTHPRLTSGTSGAGIDHPYARLWNEKWVLTFGGEITGINVGPPAKNQTGNTVQIIVLSQNGGSSFTELGPEWYVNQQRTKLRLGDKVTITGSKIMRDHRGSILARNIVVNGEGILNFRDVHGTPLWREKSGAVVKANPNVPNPAFTKEEGEARVIYAPVGQFGTLLRLQLKRVTVEGHVHRFDISKGEVTMIMRVEGGLRKIYLGPKWFVVRQEVRIMPGDSITATILAPNNLSAVAYAESVATRNGTLRFRNAKGATLWSK